MTIKLVVTGGTGLVATELIRQGLQLPQITTLVVLSRKPVAVPAGTEANKLKQVLIGDYGEYPDHARRELAGADACIWTVAITPTKSKAHDFAEVRRVCHTSTLAGFQAMVDSQPNTPFRFLYISGSAAERDQTKQPRPASMAPYMLMRGETETAVLEMARRYLYAGVAAAVVKPGLITSHVSIGRSVWGTALRFTNLATNVTVQEVAAAMLRQVVDGFEQETLENDDLRRIGRAALEDRCS